MPHATRRPRPARRAGPAALSALLALAAAAVLANGCGSDKHVAPLVRGPQLPTDAAPDSAVVRWLTAYSSKLEKEADTLLTADFHYVFSSQSDPALVSLYGNDWGRTNEVMALHNLWTGFTNDQGQYVPAASAITLALSAVSVIVDPAHPDSAAWYKIVTLSQLALDVATPSDGGTVYQIRSMGWVHVVRGDAAVLGPGQSPLATRWYVRQYDDLAISSFSRRSSTKAMPMPSGNSSWGKLRGVYASVLPSGVRLPPGTPPNTSPDSTLVRWITAYASNADKQADTLLTSDFHYHFSAQTDPVLVTLYGNTWGKANEAVSLHHLWAGFTNDIGTYLPAANSMVFDVIGMSVLGDPAHADSTAWYKMVSVLDIDLQIETPVDGGVVYDTMTPANVFLVRGDAAVLNAGQPPDPTRWYVRQVDDLTAPVYARSAAMNAANAMPLPATTSSWGRIRSMYYQ